MPASKLAGTTLALCSCPLASAPARPKCQARLRAGFSFLYPPQPGLPLPLLAGFSRQPARPMQTPPSVFFDKIEKAAFEAAHALKGVLGNLSLTSIYAPIVEITELLRNNTDMDYTSLLSNILEKKDELGRLCAD